MRLLAKFWIVLLVISTFFNFGAEAGKLKKGKSKMPVSKQRLGGAKEVVKKKNSLQRASKKNNSEEGEKKDEKEGKENYSEEGEFFNKKKPEKTEGTNSASETESEGVISFDSQQGELSSKEKKGGKDFSQVIKKSEFISNAEMILAVEPTHFEEKEGEILPGREKEIKKLIQEKGITYTQAQQELKKKTGKETLQSNLTFYVTDDEVIFVDQNGNEIYRYRLPQDTDFEEYAPEFVFISEDGSQAVVLYRKIAHASWINPNHPDQYYFTGVRVDLLEKSEREIFTKDGQVKDAIITPDASHLIIGYRHQQLLPEVLLFYDLKNDRLITSDYSIKTDNLGPSSEIVDIKLSSDNKLLYVGVNNGRTDIEGFNEVQIYDVNAIGRWAIIQEAGADIKEILVEPTAGGDIVTILKEDGRKVKYFVGKFNGASPEIRKIEDIPQEILDALRPLVEELLGVKFDENNPQHQGFLPYWAEGAEKLVEDGMPLEEAISEVISQLQQN